MLTRNVISSLFPMSEMKPFLSGHVTEKHDLGSTEKESDFNKSIYSTWAELTDLGSND